jgi:tripartite-type tricarboxylate transporter receptor subunit TctC
VQPIATEIPGFDLTSWNGIFAPAGTAARVVDTINRHVQEILKDKDVQDKLAAIGFEVKPSKSPEECQKYVADQLATGRGWSRPRASSRS